MGNIKLEKGKKIDLQKGFTKLRFTVNWGSEADVDIEATLLNNNKTDDADDFIFYNNKKNKSESIIHMGDVRSGNSEDGGTETIIIDLEKIPKNRNKIIFTASIDCAIDKSEYFGNIGYCKCELWDDTNNKLIGTYDCQNDLYGEICGKLCEIYKENDKWRVKPLGVGIGGLEELLIDVGLGDEL